MKWVTRHAPRRRYRRIRSAMIAAERAHSSAFATKQ
jgi:hypothetical protein